MTDFLVERLSPGGALSAYPLIREVAPALDLRRWIRFARLTASPRYAKKGGILAVRRSQQPFPCGLACYHRDHDPDHTAVLTVDYLVSLDMLDSRGALQALLRELEQVAHNLGCRAVRSPLQGAAPGASELIALGHQASGILAL